MDQLINQLEIQLDSFNLSARKEALDELIKRLDAGEIEFRWDGRDANGDEVPSGIYFYRFTAGNYSQTRQMILLK